MVYGIARTVDVLIVLLSAGEKVHLGTSLNAAHVVSRQFRRLSLPSLKRSYFLGKFWHRHRRPRPVEYNTDADYHINLKMEAEKVKASAKKRGGAAALRALNIQQDAPTTPASTNDDTEPPPSASRNDTWP